MKRCKICGNDRFVGHQAVRLEVITDGEGDFMDNMPEGAESAIYDSSSPYGPFTCTKCGEEYDELDELPDVSILYTFKPDYVHNASIWGCYSMSQKGEIVSEGYDFINPFCMNRKKLAETLGVASLTDDEVAVLYKSSHIAESLLASHIVSTYIQPKIDLSTCSHFMQWCIFKLACSKGRELTLTAGDLFKNGFSLRELSEFIDEVVNNKSGRFQHASEYVEVIDSMADGLPEDKLDSHPVMDIYAGLLTYFDFKNLDEKDRRGE